MVDRKDKTLVVKGEVVLPSGDLASRKAHLIVQVEDISRADAPATVVGAYRRSNVVLKAGGSLPFAVEVPASAIESRSAYSVSAYVGASASGDVGKGDFVSTQVYPVLTRGFGSTARVVVKLV
jgi:uncharacterized lipoprotein YbaY